MTHLVLLLVFSGICLGQSKLQWVRQIGGSGKESVSAVTADQEGNVYVSGTTTSPGLATVGSPLGPQLETLLRFDAGGGLRAAPPFRPNQLAVDGNDPLTVYSLTDSGLYRSRDGGATWGDSLTDLGFLWLAATGDQLVGYRFDAIRNEAVIHRSGNGGKSWSEAAPFGQIGFGLTKLAVGPGALIAYNAAQSLISSDGGTTWRIGPGFGHVAFDSIRPGVIWGVSAIDDRRSDDGGLSWQVVNSKSNAPESGPVVVGIDGAVYLARNAGIFRSSRTGEPFVRVSDLQNVSELATDSVTGRLYALVGNSLLVSDDGLVSTRMIATRVTSIVGAIGRVYAASVPSQSGYVAKITAQGDMEWLTYLGGEAGSGGRAIAVGGDGAVYVGGAAGTLGLVKISRDGQRIVWEREIGEWGKISIATYDAGVTIASAVSLQISKFVPWRYTRILRFHDNGELQGTETVGRLLDSMHSSAAGSLYAVGGSDVCWAKSAEASFECYPNLLGSMSGTAIASQGNDLWVAGSARELGFTTTGDAFQGAGRGPRLGGESHAALARVDVQNGTVGYASLLGGEGTDGAVGVVMGPQASVLVAGNTDSARFPTRTPWQGPYSGQTGFVAQLTPGSALDYSTFVGDSRPFRVVGLAAGRDGQPVVAGNTETGAFVARYELEKAALPRLDAVKNEVSLLAVPVVGNTRIRLEGAGFGEDAEVLFGEMSLRVISRAESELVADVPAGLSGSEARVAVRSGGATSNAVFMPIGRVALALYTDDGSGAGQGSIFNEDGTANSAANGARLGSVVQLRALVVGTSVVRAEVCGIEAVVLDGTQVRIPERLSVPTEGVCPILIFGAGGASSSQRGVTIAIKP
jgi:hypothetical protein